MKREIRLIVFTVLFLAIILGNLGCSKGEKDIKVGVLMPLTGTAASLGVPAFNAMQLAIDEANQKREEGDPKVVLIPEDTKALAPMGVSSIQKLINVNKIKIAIGPLTSTVTLAVSPIAEKNKFVIISPGSSAPAISESGDYIFRNELSDLDGGRTQAQIAIDKLGFKKMACVYINTDYGSGLYKVFKEVYEAKGGEIVLAEAFMPGTTDFRTIITKIISESVDAVFLIAIDEVLNFVKQKEELGLKTKIFTTPIFENIDYLNELGKLAEGILYVYYGQYDPNSTDENIKSFISKYQERFKDSPTYYSALAYDAANIIYKALKNANFELDKVKNEIYKIQGFQGVTGETSFDKNGDVSKPVSLKVVKNGKFQFYNMNDIDE